MSDWRTDYAEDWASGIIHGLETEFPAMMQHLSTGPTDCDVTPHTLHPAFWGCLDWHSSAHMQWSAVTLLGLASDQLAAPTRDALAAQLSGRLTRANGEVEAAYLRRLTSYERPYGWGWAALLAAAASTSTHPDAADWARGTRPVADAVFDNALGWLPRLVYPVRTGVHDNTAFGLGLVYDAARVLGREDVTGAIAARARHWFAGDADYPSSWEPSGNDFLSAALCEADLMRRVLPADEFRPWLAAFLPGLASQGDTLLAVPEVADRTDGKLVHLFGLALSRAWMLRSLAPYLDADRAARIAERTPRQISDVEREIVGGDFMSTHWLVSFALMAVTAQAG